MNSLPVGDGAVEVVGTCPVSRSSYPPLPESHKKDKKKRRTFPGKGAEVATAETGYRRVSKKCPCTICGKPDWCSTTATETISFCARSILGADRISRNGWGVYYRAGSGPIFDFIRVFQKSAKEKKLSSSNAIAEPSILHKVYRKLIELSPASLSNEIVNGRGGLSERRIFDVSSYGSLPKTVSERRVLIRRIIESFAKEGSTLSFAGIPGFWRDSNGSLQLGACRTHSMI